MTTPHESRLSVSSRDIEARVFPLLRDRVFHMTPAERLEQIRESGLIKTNAEGSLGNTFLGGRAVAVSRRQPAGRRDISPGRRKAADPAGSDGFLNGD